MAVVSKQDILAKIDCGDSHSRIILLVSPCRSGSTAMIRVFHAAGVPSFYQPLKSILRWLSHGRDASWTIPQYLSTSIFVKETLGPYTLAETTLDPLTLLMDAGIQAQHIHLIIMGRDPLQTWASWLAWWRHQTSLELMISAYHTAEQIRQNALQNQIPVTTLVYELFQQNQPEAIMQKLLSLLHIPYQAPITQGWHKLPDFNASESQMYITQDHGPFLTPHALHDVHTADRFIYRSRANDVQGLATDDISRIESEARLIYETWHVEAHLQFSIPPVPS